VPYPVGRQFLEDQQRLVQVGVVAGQPGSVPEFRTLWRPPEPRHVIGQRISRGDCIASRSSAAGEAHLGVGGESCGSDVGDGRGRPTGWAREHELGVSDVAGVARGRDSGAAYAARPSAWFGFPNRARSGPPTAGTAGSEATHRAAGQRLRAGLTAMSAPSQRRPRDRRPSAFIVHLDLKAGCVTAVGRLDGRSAHLLHEAVSVVLGTELPTLTVDVSGMEVADHAGLRAIGEIYRRALRRGRRITVRGASPQLRSALSRLHLGHHLLFDDAPPTADETPTPTPTP
jgi:anti-anti-sigma regulatory factor